MAAAFVTLCSNTFQTHYYAYMIVHGPSSRSPHTRACMYIVHLNALQAPGLLFQEGLGPWARHLDWAPAGWAWGGVREWVGCNVHYCLWQVLLSAGGWGTCCKGLQLLKSKTTYPRLALDKPSHQKAVGRKARRSFPLPPFIAMLPLVQQAAVGRKSQRPSHRKPTEKKARVRVAPAAAVAVAAAIDCAACEHSWGCLQLRCFEPF